MAADLAAKEALRQAVVADGLEMILKEAEQELLARVDDRARVTVAKEEGAHVRARRLHTQH